ncbi:glycosyltransferase [Bacillus sp. REN3]|uniref:glycosyltransferase n=1 Tax=Bacillus sp. REN3 TaxID=2802440 RepID=UPI001AEE0D5B
MKKIDIFISSLRGGGAERVCVTLANELSKKGYEVRLVTLNLKDSVYDKQLNKEVNLIDLNIDKARNSFLAMYKNIKKNKPQKILVFNHELAILLVMIRGISRLDFSIISRNINVLSVKRDKEKSLWHKYFVHYLIKMLYKKVNKVIAQSKGMKEDLIKHYGFNKKNVYVVNNPVSEEIEKFVEHVEKKENEVIFVGRLSKQKGINYLLESFRISLSQIPNMHLRIIGEGSLKNEVIEMINQLGLRNNVHLEGFSNNIGYYYSKAKVTILSSVYEGFPNVLVESITLGTPVVSFNTPTGPSEIIIDEINGYLAEYLNVEDLSRKLVKAYKKDWEKEKIVKSSLRYRKNTIVKEYIKILEAN